MRKIILYSVLFVTTMFFAACGGSDKSLVTETGEKFAAAILADDHTTIRSLVTPETFEKWGTTNYQQIETLDPSTKEKLRAAKSEVSNVIINGREAQLTLPVGIPGENGEINVLHLKKIGRVWFIDEPGILVKKEVDNPDTGN